MLSSRGLVWFSLAAAMIATLILGVLVAQEAHCAWCFDVPCFSGSQCGMGCSCVKFGSDPTGICVSVDVAIPPDATVFP